MKKIILPLLAISLMLTGCLENIQEVFIKEDGTGTIKTKTDLGALMAFSKQMGGGENNTGLEKKADTVIYMKEASDAIPDLTDIERQLLGDAKLFMKTDIEADQFEIGMDFLFTSMNQIDILGKLYGKAISAIVKEKAEGGEEVEPGQEPEPDMTTFDDYFITTCSNGVIEKKLNKSQYGLVDKDAFLSSLRQTSPSGLLMKTTYIYNLPRPATKAEGKGVTLSADKKKVTVAGDIDAFFDDPSMFEFRIEY